MYKLKLFSVGKTREKWLDEALQEYLKRLKPIASLEFIWAKNNEQLLQLTAKEPVLVCLDPQGNLFTSEQFSGLLHDQLTKGGSKLSFVIGGADGLPSELKQKPLQISLSRLTFTHQITRLVLIEQIYRAFEIVKNSPYHK